MMSRDEWNQENDYKVFSGNHCALCRYFTPDLDFDYTIKGICEIMIKEGVDCQISITAVCKRFRYNGM